MEIEYTEYNMATPDGVLKTTSIEKFLVHMPQIGLLISRGNMYPPMGALNELLMKGKTDAGMGGVYEWKSFSVTESEYSMIKEKLEKLLDVNLSECPDESMPLNNWFSYALKNSKNKRGRLG